MIVRYVITSTRLWDNQDGIPTRDSQCYDQTDEARSNRHPNARATTNPSPLSTRSVFSVRLPCHRHVYVHTWPQWPPWSPLLFSLFFQSPLPRTRNLLEYALLDPFLVLNNPRRYRYRLSCRYAVVPRQHTSIP